MIILKQYQSNKRKNYVGSSVFVVEIEAETQLAKACPVKKKGNGDIGEANKKKFERVLDLKTGNSFWDRNFYRTSFVKDHFNLLEDFEAERKSNHSSLFRDTSVSCLLSMVLL